MPDQSATIARQYKDGHSVQLNSPRRLASVRRNFSLSWSLVGPQLLRLLAATWPAPFLHTTTSTVQRVGRSSWTPTHLPLFPTSHLTLTTTTATTATPPHRTESPAEDASAPSAGPNGKYLELPLWTRTRPAGFISSRRSPSARLLPSGYPCPAGHDAGHYELRSSGPADGPVSQLPLSPIRLQQLSRLQFFMTPDVHLI